MKTKIFLIHPVFESGSDHTLVCRKGYGTAIPLGLGYIGAELIRHGHGVRIYDFQVEHSDIFKEIRSYKPDYIGISITTPAANTSARLIEQIKNRYSNIPVIAGGPHVTTLKGDLFKESRAYDYLVIGEGERTLVELIRALTDKTPLDQIHGIIFKNGDRFIETEPRAFIEQLDDLPYLPLNLFSYTNYIPTPGTFVHLPSVAFLSSRGCPYSCVFCNKSMFGKTLRQMSAGRMVDEIIRLKKQYHIREVNFYDDTFTVNKKRVMEFCRLLIENKVDIRWKCNSRVDTVTREMLVEMKNAGCFSISFGVESGDESVLKSIKKQITLDQVKNAFKWSKQAGLSRAAFFMLNLPGDTKQSIEKTLAFSREIDADFLSFELTKPLPGTQIRDALALQKNVKIKEELWTDWDNCAVSNTIFFTQNDLTEEYLCKAFNRAVKTFYFRPGFIIKKLLMLRSRAQFRSYVDAAINIFEAKVKGNQQ